MPGQTAPVYWNRCQGDEILEEKLAQLTISLSKATTGTVAFLSLINKQEQNVTIYYSLNHRDRPAWHKSNWKLEQEAISLLTAQDDNWQPAVKKILLPKIGKQKIDSLLSQQQPLSAGVTGILGIGSCAPDQFRVNHEAILALAASQLASLWDNSRLSQTAQQLGQEMDLLIRFSKYFSSHAGEMEQVLEKVLNELTAVIDVESCGVLLYDQDKQELVLQKPAFGVKGENFEAYKLSTNPAPGKNGIGVATKVFLTGEHYICNLVADDEITNRKISDLYGVQSSLTVPMVVDNRRIGVIHAINKKNTIFTSNDARLLELLAYQIAKVLENVRLFGQVEDKNNLLAHSMDIHNQLTRLVLRGKSLATIVRKFSQLIQRDVLVQDQFFKVLGANLTDDSEEHGKIEEISQGINISKQPVYLPAIPERGLPSARLLAPISLANNLLGYVSILEDEQGKLGELHYLAIEHAVTVFTLKMMQQKIVYDVEERIRGDFLDDLLNGNYRSAADITQRAVYLGHNLLEQHQVLVIDIDNFSDYVKKQHGNEYQLSKLKRRIFDIIKNSLEDLLPASILATKSDTFVVVAPCWDKGQASKPAKLAAYLRKRVKRLLQDITVSIGIGKVTNCIEDYALSYQEAQRAISIGKRFAKKDQIIPYESLGAYKILFIAQQEMELQQFAQQYLEAILKYDQEKNLNLVKTLSIYLDHNCHNQRSANHLFIHLNTLKYRLQKIEDLTGLDLKDAEVRLNLQLALKILEIENM